MWELGPAVKIGLDSRGDIGYSASFIHEIYAFYLGRPGWQDTLNRYPSDLILMQRSCRLALRMEKEQHSWKLVYRDDAFELWARPGLSLPIADNRGQALHGLFP